MEKKNKTKRRRGRPPKAKCFRDGSKPNYLEPKDRIKNVAIDLFHKKGFHGASIREIAEAAEVTKPVIYYHYDSKEGLYKFILREAMTEVSDLYLNFAGLIDEERPCVLLKKATKALFEWIGRNRPRANMLIFTLVTRDPAFDEICDEYVETRKKILWPVFVKGIETGNIPLKEPETAYVAFTSLVIGLEMLSCVTGNDLTTSDYANKAIDLLIGECQ